MPLLVNVYLHRFDVEVRKAGYRLIPYADDLAILADRRNRVEAAVAWSGRSWPTSGWRWLRTSPPP
jgi:hypothetical protein